MAVYVDPKDPDYVIIDCRPDGYKGKRIRQRHQLSIVSLELAQLIHDDMMRRPQQQYRPPVNTTCAGIYKQWLAAYRLERTKRTVEDAEDSWRQLTQYFGALLPKSITEDNIERYKRDKIKTLKPRTINKHLSYLSSMLKWAAKKKLCAPLDFQIPFFEKKLTRAPKPRPITQQQITAIYNAIEPDYKLVFLLMADAGLRRNEALTLKRDDVEFDSGLIFVVGKGNKERIVPVTTDRLKPELIKKVDTTGYFTINPRTEKPYLTIRKALLRAADKAGVDKHIYHHLLRHSFGTNATMAGIDVKALQGIMGHSSVDTTQMYQHLAGSYYREQGKKLQNDVHVDKIKKG